MQKTHKIKDNDIYINKTSEGFVLSVIDDVIGYFKFHYVGWLLMEAIPDFEQKIANEKHIRKTNENKQNYFNRT